MSFFFFFFVSGYNLRVDPRSYYGEFGPQRVVEEEVITGTEVPVSRGTVMKVD